jgi:hypothetical protein
LNFISFFIRLKEDEFEKEYNDKLNLKINDKHMGVNEVIKEAFNKELEKKDRIIAKKDKALIAKDEALSAKDEALSAKDEALTAKDEKIVVRSFKSGIDIKMIVNITNLTTKEVKSILKKNGFL